MRLSNFLKLTNVRLYSYKKVPRPEDFKIVSRSDLGTQPLADQIAARIRLSGPITIADYMRTVLTHPRSGYYIRSNVFGAKGDFITSPEMSQIFGEILGVWMAHELFKIGDPRPLQLVELGPGRGTLLADVVRTYTQLSKKKSEQLGIHLVEISDRLAGIQANTLSCSEIETGSSSDSHYQRATTESGIPVFWYRHLDRVPREFSVFLANEFFDALPIHKYQRQNGSWKEVLVNTKSNDPTGSAEFQLILSKSSPSPASLLIDEKETRDHVEVCPEAGKIISDLAVRLEEDGGISLIIDYGHMGEKKDTFRGFKNHALHDPLEAPGDADLTADVDFSFLKRAVSNRVLVFGPVKQRDFLLRMNIEARLNAIISQQTDPSIIESLKSGVSKIVNDMGTFHVMAMFPQVLQQHLTKYPVAGFS